MCGECNTAASTAATAEAVAENGRTLPRCSTPSTPGGFATSRSVACTSPTSGWHRSTTMSLTSSLGVVYRKLSGLPGKPASLARSARFLRPTGRCPRPLLNKTAWAREESWVRPSLQPWARSLREHGRGLGWTSDLLQRPATSPTLGSCRAGLARRIFLPAQTGVTSCLSRSGTTSLKLQL